MIGNTWKRIYETKYAKSMPQIICLWLYYLNSWKKTTVDAVVKILAALIVQKQKCTQKIYKNEAMS